MMRGGRAEQPRPAVPAPKVRSTSWRAASWRAPREPECFRDPKLRGEPCEARCLRRQA